MTCNMSECLSCSSSYNLFPLSIPSCINCEIEYGSSCLTCNSSVCLTCSSGFKLFSTNNPSCINCQTNFG